MSPAQQQFLVLSLVCLFTAIALAAMLLLTRVSKFGVFAVANFLLGAAIFGAQVFVDLSGWRSEILASAVVELPAVLLISWICLALVGGPPGRPNASPSEPVVRRPRLRRALGWAPAALLACWMLGALVGLVWPSPAMQPYSAAPVQFVAFKWPISIPQAFYAGLAANLGSAVIHRWASRTGFGNPCFHKLSTVPADNRADRCQRRPIWVVISVTWL